jgi:hypothetical protein
MDPIESVKMDPNGSEGICEMGRMDLKGSVKKVPNGSEKMDPYGFGWICENGFK